jgi:hypothetical protein
MIDKKVELADKGREAEDVKKAFERVFRSSDGRIILKELARDCFQDIGTYCNDPYLSSFREGRISEFMYIVNMATIDFSEYMGLLAERIQELSEIGEKYGFRESTGS